MNIRKELNLNDLKKITGGTWNFNTLTPEELAEYTALQDAWNEADLSQDWDLQRAIESRINAFIDRMDARYGA